MFDTLATPTGPDDARDKLARNAAALKDLVEDATGPGGLATDTHRGRAAAEDREPDPG